MGNPKNRVIVINSKERSEYVKKFVKTKPIYISVYPFRKIVSDDLKKMHESADIRWVCIDIDPDGFDPFDEMIKLHKWLSERSVLHRIHFSGRGFHIFIFTKSNVRYPKVAISNFWDYLRGDKCGNYINPFKRTKKYRSPAIKMDRATRGDLGRIIRFPNSYNFKSKCFCIILDDHLIEGARNINDLVELAQRPYKPEGNIYFGTKKVNLSEFDCTTEQYFELENTNFTIVNSIDYSKISVNKDVEFDYNDMPFCIKHIIETSDLHFVERNELIKFLINRTDQVIPYRVRDIMGILHKISEKNEWLRWFFVHSRIDILYRNVKIVYDNFNILSTCYKISNMGYCCRERCTWKNVTEKYVNIYNFLK